MEVLRRDILDDLLRLPTRNAHNTEKYKDVMNELKKSPEITRLVSHSLGSQQLSIKSMKNNLIDLQQLHMQHQPLNQKEKENKILKDWILETTETL